MTSTHSICNNNNLLLLHTTYYLLPASSLLRNTPTSTKLLPMFSPFNFHALGCITVWLVLPLSMLPLLQILLLLLLLLLSAPSQANSRIRLKHSSFWRRARQMWCCRL